MKTLPLVVANVVALRRRFVGLVVMVAIATAAVVAAIGISARAGDAAHEKVQEGAANRTVVVDKHLEGDSSESPLTPARISRFCKLPGVVGAEPSLRATFGYKGQAIPGALLYANVIRPSAPPPIKESTRSKLFPLRANEIVVPTSTEGMNLSSLLGKTIAVEVTRGTSAGSGTGSRASARVVALSDPAYQIDGPSAAYAPESLVTRWAARSAGVSPDVFRSSVGYDRISLLAASSADVPSVVKEVQTTGFTAYSLQQQFQALPGVLGLIRSATWVLMACLAAVGFLSAFTLTSALARQRTREVGIMRAIGFRRRSVMAMLTGEITLVTCFAAALGTVLGLLIQGVAESFLRKNAQLHPYLIDGPSFTSLVVLVPIVGVFVCLIGAFFPARRASRLAPGEAVKEW